MISKEEAGRIVTNRFGGDVIDIDVEQGGLVYEVEVINSSLGRIEVEVDANTGEIIEVDID